MICLFIEGLSLKASLKANHLLYEIWNKALITGTDQFNILNVTFSISNVFKVSGFQVFTVALTDILTMYEMML